MNTTMNAAVNTTLGNQQTALILLGHGSKDALWSAPLLAICAQLQAQGRVCTCAFLERSEPDLINCLLSLMAQNHAHITQYTIVPMFLGMGSHVREDLPRLLDAARARFPQARLQFSAALGEMAPFITETAHLLSAL